MRRSARCRQLLWRSPLCPADLRAGGRPFFLWPLTGRLQVCNISGASDASRAEVVAALRWEGCSLLQALEAVERELAEAATSASQ